MPLSRLLENSARLWRAILLVRLNQWNYLNWCFVFYFFSASCPSLFTEITAGQARKCVLFSSDSASWQDAKAFCESQDSYLITFSSAEESKDFGSYVDTHGKLPCGLVGMVMWESKFCADWDANQLVVVGSKI